MTERTVAMGEKGMRLERFVRLHFAEAAAEPVAALLKAGRLSVNGRKARLTDRLEPGQLVAIRAADRGPVARPASAGQGGADAARAGIAALLIHEDAALMVLNKPAGLAVHPGTRVTDDLDTMLSRLVDPATGERPLLAHRLDKETSGVIVAAKTRAVAARLGKELAARDVDKTYLAVVHGLPAPPTGSIDIALRKEQTASGGRMIAVDADSDGALAASSGYAVVGASTTAGCARVLLRPRTGRQHQLRAHMALIGHPIVGDRIYARRADGSLLPTPDGAEGGRLRLHALRIAFRHPITGEPVCFEAPEPPGFGLDLRTSPARAENSGGEAIEP